MPHPRVYAALSPDKAAAIQAETGEILTYGALETAANRGARLFRSLGLASGDTIAVWLPNTLAYFEIYWAAQRSGLYVTPLSSQLTPSEAAYILRDSGARLLIADGDLSAVPALMAQGLPNAVSHVFTHGGAAPGAWAWRSVAASFEAGPIEDEQAGYHLVYSSGTTGRPKGVRTPLSGGPATAENPLAAMIADWYDADASTVYLSPAPLYHTAPLVFSTAIQRLGGTVVLMARFDAEAALEAIDRHGVTFAQMVPTMFQRLLALPAAVRDAHPLSALRTVVHAAAPCPVETKRRMFEWFGPILYEYYGGTEANGSTFITPQEWLAKPGSVGRAMFGALHVCSDDGAACAAGETGLVYFAGGWRFEYLNDPEKTRSSRHPRHQDWSTLGDIGYLDEDGYLFLTDRQSFTIVTGGVNVYPQEIENLLASFPGVADVAVIGAPSEAFGEEVRAVVQPTDWSLATPEFAEAILAHCRLHLSPPKRPKGVDFDPALPRHDTGKLYKRQVRDRYWQGRDLRIG